MASGRVRGFAWRRRASPPAAVAGGGCLRASRTDCLSPEFFTFSADRKQRERVTDAIESEARKQRRLVKGSAGV